VVNKDLKVHRHIIYVIVKDRCLKIGMYLWGNDK